MSPDTGRGEAPTPEQLLRQLRALGGRPRGRLQCALAWSGGLDSTVLLHLLLRVRRRWPAQLQLRVLHVDHHLQRASGAFRRHCAQLARRWKVPLTVLDATVASVRGQSVEEAARTARYAALRGALQPGEWLLTAQHADDQLETLLLALLRGAGPAGLAAMPALADFGAGALLRPLLGVERAVLERYAAALRLPVVEDPTNAQLRFDRNYLRSQVVPVLRQRWPAVAATIARSARHCAAAAAVLDRIAAADLAVAADGADLEVAVLRRWKATRCKAVLRAWFAAAGLRSPDERRLQEILRLLAARPDAVPELVLSECTLRRYAGRLCMFPRHATGGERPSDAALRWDWRHPLVLPDGSTLYVQRDPHGDLDLDRLPARLCVMFAGAHPATRGRRLRKQLQELQVPLWERARVPLLFAAKSTRAGSAPLAIGDCWLHPRLASTAASRRRGRFLWQEQS